jgi:acyl carrier protein
LSDVLPADNEKSFNHEFLAVLRGFLPHLEAGADPVPDTPLNSYGLDSLAVISLMLELEDQLGVTFPDESLTPESFATTRALWETVSSLGYGSN